VTEMIRNLRDWLSDAWDWTINTVGTAWEWLRNLEWIDAIERVKQALSSAWNWTINLVGGARGWLTNIPRGLGLPGYQSGTPWTGWGSTDRSEEHTSELQSRENLVCRLLLEKKKD